MPLRHDAFYYGQQSTGNYPDPADTALTTAPVDSHHWSHHGPKPPPPPPLLQLDPAATAPSRCTLYQHRAQSTRGTSWGYPTSTATGYHGSHSAINDMDIEPYSFHVTKDPNTRRRASLSSNRYPAMDSLTDWHPTLKYSYSRHDVTSTEEPDLDHADNSYRFSATDRNNTHRTASFSSNQRPAFRALDHRPLTTRQYLYSRLHSDQTNGEPHLIVDQEYNNQGGAKHNRYNLERRTSSRQAPWDDAA
jgi:hypothetical protein